MATVNTRYTTPTIKTVLDECKDTRRISELTRGIAAARDIIAGLYTMMDDDQRARIDNCGAFRTELRIIREALTWV